MPEPICRGRDAANSCLSTLFRTRCLPAWDLGPVLFLAFRRFAAIWRGCHLIRPLAGQAEARRQN